MVKQHWQCNYANARVKRVGDAVVVIKRVREGLNVSHAAILRLRVCMLREIARKRIIAAQIALRHGTASLVLVIADTTHHDHMLHVPRVCG